MAGPSGLLRIPACLMSLRFQMQNVLSRTDFFKNPSTCFPCSLPHLINSHPFAPESIRESHCSHLKRALKSALAGLHPLPLPRQAAGPQR